MKSVLVLSDIHTGHRLAVAPDSFTLSDGGVYLANKAQRALFRAWKQVATEWARPDVLVVNGEPIDGQQPKDKGVEAWTTNYIDQVKCAVELVKMFKAKKIYVTRGSNYHVSIGGVSIEEMFGQMVGAEKVDGAHVVPELFLTVDGVKFNLAHHVAGSVSGWMYRSTPAAKEMMLATLNQSHRWPFDVIIRSHNHYFWEVASSSKRAILTPGWQLQNWFAYRRTASGSIPDIGAVRFVVDKGSYEVQKKLFLMPEWKPPRVEV